jgi:hypothetical protein
MPRVLRAVQVLRSALAALEPDTFSVENAAELAEELAGLENACGAARVRLAARASLGGAHRARGFADVADWMANSAGGTRREARRALDVGAAVECCPDTRDALRTGEVSLEQADEIVRTVAQVPSVEPELLALAKHASLGALREVARERRLAAIDPDELYAHQHKAREFSHWRDGMGMVRGSFALTPDVGVAIVNYLDRATDRLRRKAQNAGVEFEPRAALAADALAAALAPRGTEGSTSEASARTSVPSGWIANVVIDWPALARGHIHA